MPLVSQADELVGNYSFTSNSGSINDLAISAIFFIVVALLSVVTAGVIYLGVMQALDKKQEMDDKQEVGSRLKEMPSGFLPGKKKAAQEGGGKEEQDMEFATGRRAAIKAKRDKTKGFGASEEND